MSVTLCVSLGCNEGIISQRSSYSLEPSVVGKCNIIFFLKEFVLISWNMFNWCGLFGQEWWASLLVKTHQSYSDFSDVADIRYERIYFQGLPTELCCHLRDDAVCCPCAVTALRCAELH